MLRSEAQATTSFPVPQHGRLRTPIWPARVLLSYRASAGLHGVGRSGGRGVLRALRSTLVVLCVAACALRFAQVLHVVLDDLSGGLGAAASKAVAAHLPLEQLALPDGSVTARLPLHALRGDDTRVRSALAVWNSPAGWLRAPVARLLLVGGRERDFAEQLALAATAAEAAEATRTPWALVHVVQAPDRDGEETLGDALRARFPAPKTARVTLTPDGGPASTAALDARLGECLREALSWRVDAFRGELDRLTRETAETAAGPGEKARGAEFAAEVADGLAALLEAARWHEPALAACDSFAALLEPRCPLFARLLPGGTCLDDGTRRLLVDAAALTPEASLSRFELRHRCFARAARLLQWAGLHEELGVRGLSFVRSVAAELAASAEAQMPSAPADMSHPRCIMHLWASGACLQLAAVLRRAASGLLNNTGAQEQTVAAAALRVRQLARMQGALYTLALTHIRALSKLLPLERSEVAASFFEELGELTDAEPLHLLRSSFATNVSCEAFCLQLSFAAASVLLSGGHLRAAAKLNLAAGLALVERGAVRRGCSLLVPCCQALIAEGWGSMVAAPLSALIEAAALAGDSRARTDAALMLLSLFDDAVTTSARVAALDAIGDIQNTPADAINCSGFIAVALPRGTHPLRLSCDNEDETSAFVVELHNALPLALELRDPVLRVVDAQQRTVLCAGPPVCVLPPGMQQLTFTLVPRAARAGSGGFFISALEARLQNAHVTVQPRRWSPHMPCSSVPARWPPIVVSSLSAGSNAPAFVVVEAEQKYPSVQLVLPLGSLILGTSAAQLVGLCVAPSSVRPFRKATLKVVGGQDLDIPKAQTALLRMHDSDSAGAVWQRKRMVDSIIELPDMPLTGTVVIWLHVHLRFQTTLRAADPLDGVAGNESAVFRIEALLEDGIVSSALTLSARAEAAFSVSSSTKQLPGVDGAAALFARVVSQMQAPSRLRSVALRPHQSGSSAACGRAQCDCKRTHMASSLLNFPLTLQTGGEVATLFQLRPCSSVPFAFLDLEFECDAPELRSQPAAADWLDAADTGLTPHSCSVLVRLPDVPPLRVSRFAASLGRVGETIRMRWQVHRLDVGSAGEDAGPSSLLHIDASSFAAELQATMSAPFANSAPAYEADDERDDTSHVARGARLSESSQSIWSLRAELQAPASRWLLLGLRDTSLALSNGEMSTIVAECVPVVAGELEAPRLLLRWSGSGAAVRGVWEDPPAAATVQVLPACQ